MNFRELVIVVEDQRQALGIATTTRRTAVDVVPAVVPEHVLDGRAAEDEAHLALGHSRLELPRHVFRNDVTLLNLRLVGERQVGDGAAGKQDGAGRE